MTWCFMLLISGIKTTLFIAGKVQSISLECYVSQGGGLEPQANEGKYH